MGSELIFVSYSSNDRPFAIKLTEELEKLGANIWIDQLGIELGENWDGAIEKALDDSNSFLLLISPTSVESPNVQDEVSIAIEENKKMIPVLIKPCELPMRWKRRQYADLTSDSEKALKEVLNALGLDEGAVHELKNIVSFIGDSEELVEEQIKSNEVTAEETLEKEFLLVSDAEVDQAVKMHHVGIKKNSRLIIIVAIGSLALIGLLFYLKAPLDDWMIIMGGLFINLMSVRPFGGIKSRQRKIDLMGLLKLKRARLARVANKLDEEEIEKFNGEFLNYITV